MIKAYFMDNQEVGADELNALVRMFAGGGVADAFKDGVPYNVSALNGVYYAALKPGVVPESDSSLSVTASDGVAFAAPGTAIFPDGTYAIVSTESGANESVSYTSGAEQYIYLKSDRVSNAVSLLAASSAPGDGDNAVLLAKIAADGSVTDLRRYAKGKIPSVYASDTGLAGRRVFTVNKDTSAITFSTSAPYRYMFLRGGKSGRNWQTLAWVDLSTMQALSVSTRSKNEDNDRDKVYARTDGTFVVAESISFGGYDLSVMGALAVSNGTYTITLTHYANYEGGETYMYPAEIEIVLV